MWQSHSSVEKKKQLLVHISCWFVFHLHSLRQILAAAFSSLSRNFTDSCWIVRRFYKKKSLLSLFLPCHIWCWVAKGIFTDYKDMMARKHILSSKNMRKIKLYIRDFQKRIMHGLWTSKWLILLHRVLLVLVCLSIFPCIFFFSLHYITIM